MRTPRFLLTTAAIGAVGYAAHIADERAAVLAFVSTAPWLLLCHPTAGPTTRSLAVFLTMVYTMALMSLAWLMQIGVGGWLIAPLFYVVHLIPTFALSRLLFALWPAAPLSVLWPLAFTSGEWIRISVSPGQVPFCQLAQALVAFPRLMQSVDIGGAWMLSGTAASTAGLAASVAMPGLTGRARSAALFVREAALPGCLLLSGLVYGHFQLDDSFLTPGPQALIVQPNTPTWREDDRAVERIHDLVEMTRSSAAAASPELVVWPENSLILDGPDDGESSSDRIDLLRSLAKDIKSTIVSDGSYYPELSGREHHAAMVVFPSGRVERSDKVLLVPWSEYVPFRSGLNQLRSGLGDSFELFVRSHNPHLRPVDAGASPPRLFKLSTNPTVLFSVPICYELLSAREMNAVYRRALDQDAMLVFTANVVNELLLGESVHRQTVAYSRLRAVEGRVTVLRAANNGISVAINSNGMILPAADSAPVPEVNGRGTLLARVSFDSRFGTLYTRFGDFVPAGCLALAVVLIALPSIRQFKKTRAMATPSRDR